MSRLSFERHSNLLIMAGLVALAGMGDRALAISSADYNRASQLQQSLTAGDATAADDIGAFADGSPEVAALYLDNWVRPLTKMKRFDAIEKIADAIIHHRPFAWPQLADAQKARAAALLGEEKYADALIEAKRYYDVCALARTDDALAMVAIAMRGVDPAGAEATIKTMLAEQHAAAPEDRTLAADLAAKAGPATGVLSTVAADAKPFEEFIAMDLGSDTYETLMGRGNLLLLAGKPGEAKAVFRQAAESCGKTGKDLTRAIEGVARTLRAEDGNPARANAFIAELSKKP